jgi:GTPase
MGRMNVAEQARAVEETLEEIGATDKRVVLALNKIDRLVISREQSDREIPLVHSAISRFARNDKEPMVTQDSFFRDADAVQISALTGQGLGDLLARVEAALAEEMVELRVRIPYNANELVALFHQRGIVEREEFVEKGTLIEGRIAASLVSQYKRYKI